MQPLDESVEGTVVRGMAALLAVAAALPTAADLTAELVTVDAAVARGYFLPDEDEQIRRRYLGYLSLRTVLLETLEELAEAAGRGSLEWRQRLPVFATAFAAACVLARSNRYVTDRASGEPLLWKKLDEADVVAGVPRKTFTQIFKSATSVPNLRRFLAATDFYFSNREAIRALGEEPRYQALTALLTEEESLLERRRRDALKRLFAYRWFSFLRRHRSAWRQVMFGIFEASGRAISEMRQPGVKPSGAPKRITSAMQAALPVELRAGDVLVTRHDDAMSNWFLPGYWPHTALYLGSGEECAQLGLALPFEAGGRHWFLEAKKDGVRYRLLSETLRVDAFIALRSPLAASDLATALKRAMSHAGKSYDFLFDFRTSDCLACSEVVYRGFHGIGPIRFHLEERGGRLCLPTEEFLKQALAAGFRVIATGGVRGEGLRRGAEAEADYVATSNR